jgi:hypothetical protein
MEKFTRTTVRELQTGDRFYKASDAKKQMYEIVERDVKKTAYRHYHFWALKDGFTKPDPLNGDTLVVFVRNSKDTIQF